MITQYSFTADWINQMSIIEGRPLIGIINDVEDIDFW